MNDIDKEFALSITKAVMRRPFAAPFLEPVDMDEDWAQDYLKKINNPVDLRNILSKIENDKYKNIKEWKNEFSLVWKNAKEFFGAESYVTELAHQLRKYFLRISNQEKPLSNKEWATEVESIKEKFEKFVSKYPPSKVNEFCEAKLGCKEMTEMSKDEMRDLVTASKALSNIHDARAMFGIIHGMNPNVFAVSEDVKLDLKTISPRSQRMLEWYIKTRFSEEGLTYPKP